MPIYVHYKRPHESRSGEGGGEAVQDLLQNNIFILTFYLNVNVSMVY